MTRTPEEEARRDEALLICEELAQGTFFDTPMLERIKAVAQPPGRWPLRLVEEVPGFGGTYSLTLDFDGDDNIKWQWKDEDEVEEGELSAKNMDRLFVAWAEERGIDLLRHLRAIEHAQATMNAYDLSSWAPDIEAIRAVLDNAKGAST